MRDWFLESARLCHQVKILHVGTADKVPVTDQDLEPPSEDGRHERRAYEIGRSPTLRGAATKMIIAGIEVAIRWRSRFQRAGTKIDDFSLGGDRALDGLADSC